MSEALATSTLSRDEARFLTDEVKHDAERLWRKLVELYDGGAHLALGYSSWGSYFEAEFGGSETKAYRLLQSGRVMSQLPIGSRAPANESVARELAPLLDAPETLREAWAEASANGAPTAADVRGVVARHRPTLSLPLDEETLARQQRETLIRELDRAVYSLESPASAAAAEAQRLLAEGDPGPFTPSRFDRVAEYASAFARALREAGIDG